MNSQQVRKNNTKEPLIQHQVPDMPRQKIACDLLALGGKDYLLSVNYYSKWGEIGLLRNSTMSSKVITQLTSSFARYGIPDEVIPTSQFTSQTFKQFADSPHYREVPSIHKLLDR